MEGSTSLAPLLDLSSTTQTEDHVENTTLNINLLPSLLGKTRRKFQNMGSTVTV